MEVLVKRSALMGRTTAPPSKSYTHRGLLCAALAEGRSRVLSPLVSDDTEATAEVLSKLGVKITRNWGVWEVEGGGLHEPEEALYCRESGTTLRMTAALCTFVEGACTLTGAASLTRRPVGPLIDGLNQLGADCTSSDGFPPVVVRGRGRLRGGAARIRGDVSSQFVSAILLVAPRAEEGVTLRLTTPLESRPYVLMTMETQRAFNVDVQTTREMNEFTVQGQRYEPSDYVVEGDWSSASYLLAGGALAGSIELTGLKGESSQADAAMGDILRMIGADISIRDDSIAVERSRLRGIDFEVFDCPDLFPILSVLCAAAEGDSVIRGIRRLRLKESDRVAAVAEGLTRMGVKTVEEENSFTIRGSTPRGGVIDPHGDHRIAMAFGVLGLAAEGETRILDGGCVSKSFPGFWRVLEDLGADIRRRYDE